MADFAALRQRMVDNQIRTGGVTDHAVLEAFLTVPRELFVAAAERPFAYADRELPLRSATGAPRTTMPAAQLAKMIQLLPLRAGGKAMVVGCGAGYSAAILARLTREVIAVEQDPELVAAAGEALRAYGAANVRVAQAALLEGFAAEAPYDAVLVDGAVEFIPDSLIVQLAPGGALAAIVRDGGASRAMLYENVGGEAARWPHFDAWAGLLPGFARKREFVF
jgi:protein-L-isoaspartate(D-aspartate) O-methyltransferase